MIRASMNTPMTPVQMSQPAQKAAAQPAKAEAAPATQEKAPVPKDENKAKSFNETPMRDVSSTSFSKSHVASMDAVKEIGKLMEAEAPEETEAPQEAQAAPETEETQEAEAPEAEGEVESAESEVSTDAEVEESEESEESADGEGELLEDEESEEADYVRAEVDLDVLLRLSSELKKLPSFALAESWNLFTSA